MISQPHSHFMTPQAYLDWEQQQPLKEVEFSSINFRCSMAQLHEDVIFPDATHSSEPAQASR